MKPSEARKRWTVALRSGRFKQGKGQLRNLPFSSENPSAQPEYCCLGVACLVFNEIADEHPSLGLKPVTDNELGQGTLTGSLARVKTFFGLREGDGRAARMALPIAAGRTNNPIRSLVQANDTGISFERIADIIERNEKVLFYEDHVAA